jgi:hypothetical protein
MTAMTSKTNMTCSILCVSMCVHVHACVPTQVPVYTYYRVHVWMCLYVHVCVCA